MVLKEQFTKKLSQAQSRYLNVLIDSRFQRVNRLFVLSFEGDESRKIYKQYFLPTGEIKDYNVVIDGRNFFDQPIKIDLKAYSNIRKIVTSEDDNYTITCLLDYPFSKKYCKLIARDLSKQIKLDSHPKAMQQINVTGSLSEEEMLQCILALKKQKKQFLIFQKEQLKYYDCILFWYNIGIKLLNITF